MGEKSKKMNRKKGGNWTPPEEASAYFYATSDYEFRAKHPIGYFFLVMLGVVALFLPIVIYLIFVLPYDINSYWIILGLLGGFAIGIGLFNFVAIIIKQYLGHIVSILSFIIGGILIWTSLVQMGIL